MGDALAFVVDALAVYRLAHLVTTDEITRPLRNRVIRFAYENAGSDLNFDDPDMVDPDEDLADLALADGPNAPRLAYLVACMWCASVWCAALAVIVRTGAEPIWAPVAWGLAVAGVAAIVHTVQAKLDG